MGVLRRRPLLCAGFLMGAGLGGFADGILFHQILQWHHMVSSRIPADTLVNLKVNMFWDGVFHSAVWVMTSVGLAFLWEAGKHRDVIWSGKTFGGALLAGWGLFNIVEGLIDHQILGIHHVDEYAAGTLTGDALFIGFGIVVSTIGGLLIRRGA